MVSALKSDLKIRAVGNILDAEIWSQGGEYQSFSNSEKDFLVLALASCVILGKIFHILIFLILKAEI